MVAIGCTSEAFFTMKNGTNAFINNELTLADVSPEKAGVGGSIPSLATTF